MIVHLIGLNHRHQLSGYEHGAGAQFDTYLSHLCKIYNVDLVAEELNEDAISLWRAADSVARIVALRLSIRHLFCDPGKEDRARLGILSRKEIAARLGFGKILTQEQDAIITAEENKAWPTRESFWLERLRSVSFIECAFILGSQHVESFDTLLSTEGFGVHIAHRIWEP